MWTSWCVFVCCGLALFILFSVVQRTTVTVRFCNKPNKHKLYSLNRLMYGFFVTTKRTWIDSHIQGGRAVHRMRWPVRAAITTAPGVNWICVFLLVLLHSLALSRYYTNMQEGQNDTAWAGTRFVFTERTNFRNTQFQMASNTILNVA